MAQKTLEKRDEDILDKNYWKPTEVGNALQGEIVDIYDKFYDEKDPETDEVVKRTNQGKVLLIKCSDNSLWETKPHVDLREYIPQLQKGDKVTLTIKELKPIPGNNYPKMIYSVAVEE